MTATIRFIVAGPVLIALLVSIRTVAGEAIPLVPGLRQLFLDDGCVAEMTHLQRTMHQPEKRGAVLKPDPGINEKWIQIRSAPMWVESEGHYKMTFISLRGSRSDNLLAISTDGLNWQRPQPARPGISPPNKLVVENPKPKFDEPSNVVFDPDDPDPARRFKAIVGAEARLPAVSPDCLTFRLFEMTPLTSSDESQLMYDRQRGRFLAMLKIFGRYGRSVGLSTSSDFERWTPVKQIFAADEEDQRRAHDVIRARAADKRYAQVLMDPEPPVSVEPKSALVTWACDVYNMAVFPYQGLYIGLPAMFYRTALDARKTNTDGFHEIQLVFSRDLETWHRAGNREPFIPPSPVAEGVFDRTQLLPSSMPIERGDELWFYYTGMKWRDCLYELHPDMTPRPRSEWSPEEIADFDEGGGAVCLAVLRRDGFVSLDAGEQPGQMLTRPLKVDGRELFINADIRSGGSIRLDVLDEQGQVISGFSRDEVVPIRAGGVRVRPVWQTGMDWSMLEGRVVSLRFEMIQASLYSFWTERGATAAP